MPAACAGRSLADKQVRQELRLALTIHSDDLFPLYVTPAPALRSVPKVSSGNSAKQVGKLGGVSWSAGNPGGAVRPIAFLAQSGCPASRGGSRLQDSELEALDCSSSP